MEESGEPRTYDLMVQKLISLPGTGSRYNFMAKFLLLSGTKIEIMLPMKFNQLNFVIHENSKNEVMFNRSTIWIKELIRRKIICNVVEIGIFVSISFSFSSFSL